MRLLVFCGSRKTIERFDMGGWFVIVNQYPLEQRQRILQKFQEMPGAKMAVDRSMLHGWRAPDDTVVLFDKTWPYPLDSAESIQAAARVRETF